MKNKITKLSTLVTIFGIFLLFLTLNIQGVFASEAPSLQQPPSPLITISPSNTNATISVPYNSITTSGTNLLVPTGTTAVVVSLSGINSTGSNTAFHIGNAANPSLTPSPTPSTIKTFPTLPQLTTNNLYTNPSSNQLVIYQPSGLSLTTTSPITQPTASVSQTPVPTATPTPTPARSVKITYPNGGETFKVGDKVRITWDSSKIDTVMLGYSFGVGSLNNITSLIPNQGYYDWTVNIGNTTNTKVKIDISAYETGRGSVIDQSDDFFTVNPNFDKVSPCPPIGDINGDKVITEADSQAVLQIVAALPPYQNPTADQIKRADVNGDGRVMSSDALRILRYIKGMDTTFKACFASVPQPNLGIESISFPPNPYAPKLVGDSIDLDVVIKNYGTVDILGDSPSITKVQVRKQPDSSFPLFTACTPQLIGPIKAGESITQKIRNCGIYDVAGNWNFNVTVDSTNVVTESNEQDNTIVSGPIVNPTFILSSPTSQPTSTPTPSPTTTPTSTPIPTVTPSNNVNGSVSVVPPTNSSPSPTITPSGIISFSGSSYGYPNNNGGNSSYFSIGPSQKPSNQITTITPSPKQQNIFVTGFTFVIQSLTGILSFFGIVR